MRLSARSRSRSLLRLSGRAPDPAPEQKSEDMKAVSVFRRFFHVLSRLERRERPEADAGQDRRSA